ncbi:uncharacterized protein BKA55DRAFT_721790 [Fusarium redolens]|uniref:Uncharacterized protein n=1 Tax=Fusarium redolens TaxID=48865 RepID=A0A9P9HPY3_FUSRE|nr:uncharacterized protein BKA55DRAFT_721790 [Fusarium redolens]KAH7260662.1 hypothetical protein BKA55DRAFT_721790 [Fusarium redolens]
MASRYLLLDECMCLLDKGEGIITKSESILKVGVEKAMGQVVWRVRSSIAAAFMTGTDRIWCKKVVAAGAVVKSCSGDSHCFDSSVHSGCEVNAGNDHSVNKPYPNDQQRCW